MRLKARVAEDDADAIDTLVPAVGGRQLVRARGLRPVRRRASRATPTCAASSCTRSSSGTRCARTTRRRSASRSCAATPDSRSRHYDDEPTLRTTRSRPPRRDGRPRDPGRRRTSTTPELPTEPMPLNMGPSHPAMHGTVRMVLERRGRDDHQAPTCRSATCTAASRRSASAATWTQVFPYTDRLNYVSPMLNNVGYALAVEKLLGIDERSPSARSTSACIVGEIVAHHRPPDVPAAPARWSSARSRRSSTCSRRASGSGRCSRRCRGARLTHSYVRIGGMADDLPPTTSSREAARHPRAHVDDGARGRRASCSTATASSSTAWTASAIITQDDALALGWTGPCLRSTGVDVRRAQGPPVPASTTASTSTCRSAPTATTSTATSCASRRCEQSMRILEQALEQIPAGPGHASTIRASSCRPRARSTTRSKAMIAHFKIIMDGIKVPAGEVYSYTEGGNGELGFYIVSDGSGTPLEVPRAPALLRIDVRSLHEAAARPVHRRHRPDLRHDEHDRRRVRPLMAETPTRPPDDAAPTAPARRPARSPAGDRDRRVTIDGRRTSSPRAPNLLEACNAASAPTSRSSATTRACRRRRCAASAWSTSRASPSWCRPATRRSPTRWR